MSQRRKVTEQNGIEERGTTLGGEAAAVLMMQTFAAMLFQTSTPLLEYERETGAMKEIVQRTTGEQKNEIRAAYNFFLMALTRIQDSAILFQDPGIFFSLEYQFVFLEQDDVSITGKIDYLLINSPAFKNRQYDALWTIYSMVDDTDIFNLFRNVHITPTKNEILTRALQDHIPNAPLLFLAIHAATTYFFQVNVPSKFQESGIEYGVYDEMTLYEQFQQQASLFFQTPGQDYWIGPEFNSVQNYDPLHSPLTHTKNYVQDEVFWDELFFHFFFMSPLQDKALIQSWISVATLRVEGTSLRLNYLRFHQYIMTILQISLFTPNYQEKETVLLTNLYRILPQ